MAIYVDNNTNYHYSNVVFSVLPRINTDILIKTLVSDGWISKCVNNTSTFLVLTIWKPACSSFREQEGNYEPFRV